MMTSSPGLRSRHATASCSAVVPLETATPYRLPQYAAHFASNSSMNLPAEDIHPVRKHSLTFSTSATPNEGSLTGITLEALLFIDTRIRTLLDFQQDGVFLHAKTVTAADHEHD